ncbi:MAG TPA: class I SAM-dependent methyltransferase [Anaerolineaceae bacterium]|nr:class I SAM-dependent methyltransferase [Anaerolineaceae bacterium]
MSDVFGKDYSSLYDGLYQEKNYPAECDLIERAMAVYAQRRIHTILDLGCGTGSHAVLFAQRGYAVTGVDRSEAMLRQAQLKTVGMENAPVYVPSDLKGLRLEKKFDVVLMMFAVLGYQYTNEEVQTALQTVREHLEPGGIFIFDVWYGPAVLHIRPSDRVRLLPDGEGGQILRVASGSLDVFNHLAEVRYQLWQKREDRILREAQEAHQMRYFFPQELALFLQQAGMELVALSDFADLACKPDEETWNVLGVARLAG